MMDVPMVTLVLRHPFYVASHLIAERRRREGT